MATSVASRLVCNPDAIARRAASSSKASSSSTVATVQVSNTKNGRCRSLVLQNSMVGVKLTMVRSHVTIRAMASGFVVRAASDVVGQDPEWSDDDYIVLGVAHCFRKDENGRLKDAFVVEPVTAGTLECMENGGVTCYKFVTATTLGVALKQDLSLLPPEFQTGADICEEFDFRAKCASRTWKRDHPQQNLLHLTPKDGVRSDFNFSLQDKRVLNAEVVVNDSDNIKQDMSIDVYGRAKEEEIKDEISSLYSV